MTVTSQLFLGDILVGATVRVVALDLERDFVEWLRAVGIHEGVRVTVLRRALFGGPIHVRTGAGGEFALNRQLAHSIHVTSLSEDAPDREPAKKETRA